MKNKIVRLTAFITLISATAFSLAEDAKSVHEHEYSSYHHHGGNSSKKDKILIEKLKKQIGEIAKTKRAEQANLANFDDLDFNVFSNQEWENLSRSHHKDIVVHWPDGHITNGIETHIADLKAMFVFAPDTRIKEHSIRIASEEWTAVYGFMEGTFTRPMVTADGKTIPATGKAYRIGMITIGHWTKEGVMDEEWLQWDNQSFMSQIGLGQ